MIQYLIGSLFAIGMCVYYNIFHRNYPLRQKIMFTSICLIASILFLGQFISKLN